MVYFNTQIALGVREKIKESIPAVNVYIALNSKIIERCPACGGKIIKTDLGVNRCENAPKCVGIGRQSRSYR